eukprot:6188082-Pleurochrysis_carterae.AAC.5
MKSANMGNIEVTNDARCLCTWPQAHQNDSGESNELAELLKLLMSYWIRKCCETPTATGWSTNEFDISTTQSRIELSSEFR